MEYRPRPDFQPHLASLPYRAGSQRMGILTVGGPQALGDRPCRARHHVAVCKQESLSFVELPNLQPPSQGDFSLVPCSSEGWGLLSSPSSPTDGWGSLQLSPEGWPPCHHSYPDFRPRLGWIPDSGVPLGGDAASGSSGTHPGAAGIAAPQGRQGAGKADSWPHGTTFEPRSLHSDSSLHDVVSGPMSPPRLPESQGRGSHGVEKEKLACEYCVPGRGWSHGGGWTGRAGRGGVGALPTLDAPSRVPRKLGVSERGRLAGHAREEAQSCRPEGNVYDLPLSPPARLLQHRGEACGVRRSQVPSCRWSQLPCRGVSANLQAES
ncbi:hypothetical protein KIL84_008156 [Mauremys mutica]|uniref:Uncharacterized protein n=1 Tax=Mauremys mutica TaxID=74926 RepID=A0A9D4ANU0_9SAUR|nr:hypothetical protein KIL84_008156 [Mauremys mutica]